MGGSFLHLTILNLNPYSIILIFGLDVHLANLFIRLGQYEIMTLCREARWHNVLNSPFLVPDNAGLNKGHFQLHRKIERRSDVY